VLIVNLLSCSQQRQHHKGGKKVIDKERIDYLLTKEPEDKKEEYL